jgi:glutathione S-transferase
MITLFHHPFSRAAGVVWALEEVGQPYELKFIDLMKGDQKTPELVKLNPMGKLPVLTDGDAVITESAAIDLYLADRYALGKLAPALDDPRRGTYLRWSLFAPSVIEPGSMALAQKWDFKASQAGWGEYAAMMTAVSGAVARGPFLLGDMFSMADVIFGGTVRFMTMFGMMKPTPEITAYLASINARPALKRADEKNQAIMKERGLKMPGQ